MYPEPRSQLAQNALLLVKMFCLPEEGGWMQRERREWFLDCSLPSTVPGNYPGKSKLTPKFMPGNFLTIFPHGWLLCRAWACPDLQHACDLCVKNVFMGQNKAFLPACSLPLGWGRLVFFQVLSCKCVSEQKCFWTHCFCASGHRKSPAPSRKHSGDCRIRFWEVCSPCSTWMSCLKRNSMAWRCSRQLSDLS